MRQIYSYNIILWLGAGVNSLTLPTSRSALIPHGLCSFSPLSDLQTILYNFYKLLLHGQTVTVPDREHVIFRGAAQSTLLTKVSISGMVLLVINQYLRDSLSLPASVAAMGKSQSKLTPEEIKDLQSHTNCEPPLDLPSRSVQVLLRTIPPVNQDELKIWQAPLTIQILSFILMHLSLPVSIGQCSPDNTGTRISCGSIRMAGLAGRNSGASTSGSSPPVIRANLPITSSVSLTLITTTKSTLRSSSARSPSPHEATLTKSWNVRTPRSHRVSRRCTTSQQWQKGRWSLEPPPLILTHLGLL